MNHNFAKLGDVWKHLPLAEILRIRPPAQYWETHAGSASYPLTESPERLHGAIGFVKRAPNDQDLSGCAYLRALTSTPGVYPGSPALALGSLGINANFLFCDTDPESVASLEAASHGHSVQVIRGDGVSTVDQAAKGGIASPTDVVVHIDPFDPFERFGSGSKTPIELAAVLAADGYRVVYWYGYESENRRGWAHADISRLAPGAALWCGDTLMPAPFISPDWENEWGCGIVLANATREETAQCERLGHALSRVCRNDTLPGNIPDHLTFEVLS